VPALVCLCRICCSCFSHNGAANDWCGGSVLTHVFPDTTGFIARAFCVHLLACSLTRRCLPVEAAWIQCWSRCPSGPSCLECLRVSDLRVLR
jgi:hypothetical protein